MVLFEESQKLNPVITGLMVVMSIFFLLFILLLLLLRLIQNPFSIAVLLVLSGLNVVLTVCILLIRLKTIITRDTIEFAYFPIPNRKRLSLSSIESVRKRGFPELHQTHGNEGSTIRLQRYDGGTAWYMDKTDGIEIVTNDGRGYFLGSHKVEELLAAIQFTKGR